MPYVGVALHPGRAHDADQLLPAVQLLTRPNALGTMSVPLRVDSEPPPDLSIHEILRTES